MDAQEVKLTWMATAIVDAIVFTSIFALHLVSFVSSPYNREATAEKKKDKDIFEWFAL